jgi:transposase-like protein
MKSSDHTYEVNALDGQAFVYINQEIDHGLVQALREDVIPWVEQNAPVSVERQRRMDADLSQPRFTVVFDREGYSPDLFEELQQRRIAVLSYHRYPKGDWEAEEFHEHTVELADGERVKIQLAERQTRLPQGLVIREVRKLSEHGRQISLVTTHQRLEIGVLAASLFARWAQENFFRYMRQHYALDALVERGSQAISDTEVALNPAWRTLNSEVRKRNDGLRKERARFATVSLTEPLSPAEVTRYQAGQAQQQEKIEHLERELSEIRQQRKTTAHHIPVKDLPEKDRFTRLLPERKHFLDTIKMISYRAETSLALILREKMARADDARALLLQIFNTEIDLIPDPQAQTLTVRLHHLAQAAHDEAARHLCLQLNDTRAIFPDTDLRLIFQVGGSA